MIDFLKFLTDREAGDDDVTRAEELQVAVATLLVRASRIDGETDPAERDKLENLLRREFDLDEEALARLLKEAGGREEAAVDLYRFTSIVTRELDQDGRKRLVRMLWEVVLADGVEDPFESNLVWRVAELVGVRGRERMLIKKDVAAAKGLA